jgi:hypothetical protein
MGNAKTGFKGVNDPNTEEDEKKAAEQVAKSDIKIDKDRPQRNDNLSVGGPSHTKESR